MARHRRSSTWSRLPRPLGAECPHCSAFSAASGFPRRGDRGPACRALRAWRAVEYPGPSHPASRSGGGSGSAARRRRGLRRASRLARASQWAKDPPSVPGGADPLHPSRCGPIVSVSRRGLWGAGDRVGADGRRGGWCRRGAGTSRGRWGDHQPGPLRLLLSVHAAGGAPDRLCARRSRAAVHCARAHHVSDGPRHAAALWEPLPRAFQGDATTHSPITRPGIFKDGGLIDAARSV